MFHLDLIFCGATKVTLELNKICNDNELGLNASSVSQGILVITIVWRLVYNILNNSSLTEQFILSHVTQHYPCKGFWTHRFPPQRYLFTIVFRKKNPQMTIEAGPGSQSKKHSRMTKYWTRLFSTAPKFFRFFQQNMHLQIPRSHNNQSIFPTIQTESTQDLKN